MSYCMVCLSCPDVCVVQFSLIMASGLAPRFSLHRRKGCRGCAVPLLLVLPLFPACPQVLRGRLEALGGEVLCWGRRDRPHLGQAAGSPLTCLLYCWLWMESSSLGFVGLSTLLPPCWRRLEHPFIHVFMQSHGYTFSGQSG